MIFIFSSKTHYTLQTYNLNVMRQSACLIVNPIMVDNYAAFFNCTPGSGVRLYDGHDKGIHFIWLSIGWPTGVQLVFYFCFEFQYVIQRPVISIAGQLTEYVSLRFLFILVVIMIYLFVLDDSLTS